MKEERGTGSSSERELTVCGWETGEEGERKKGVVYVDGKLWKTSCILCWTVGSWRRRGDEQLNYRDRGCSGDKMWWANFCSGREEGERGGKF